MNDPAETERMVSENVAHEKSRLRDAMTSLERDILNLIKETTRKLEGAFSADDEILPK